MRFKFFFSLAIALLLFGAVRLYYRLTDDFRLSNITYELPQEERWRTPTLSFEERGHLAAILDQKYYYLGKGAQSYAFVSADHRYVLKFFKFKHLKPNLFVDLLPPIHPFKSYKEQSVERKKRKLIGVFDGYALAYQEHRSDAGLLYLHLLPTETLKQKVTVVDKIGIERKLDLDPLVFLIQKKGVTLRSRLSAFLQENRQVDAQKAIVGIVDMYLSEYSKGIYDRDHGVMQNTGFIEEVPFHLDVGKLSKNDQMRERAFYKKDLQHVLWKIDHWIKASFPALAPLFTPFLVQLYRERMGEELDMEAIDPREFKSGRHRR